MEHFANALTVRIRSHHRTFLSADDDDEDSARQERNGAARSSRWTVELVPNSPGFIRLRSSHCRYLSASDRRSLLPGVGRKVLLLAIPTSSINSIPSLQWKPLLDGERVKLQSHAGTYLRANGLIRPYRGSVTHGDPKRTLTQESVFWEVDVLELRTSLAARSLPLRHSEELLTPPVKPLRTVVSEKCSRESSDINPSVVAKRWLSQGRVEGRMASPERQGSTVAAETPPRCHPVSQWSPESDESRSHVTVISRGSKEGEEAFGEETSVESGEEYPISELGSTSSSPCSSPGRAPPTPLLSRDLSMAEGRVIHYYVVDEEGEVDNEYPSEPFNFKGSSVQELTRRVEQMTGLQGLILCFRDVLSNDRLRRLQLHLPPNRNSMVVVAVPPYHPVAWSL